MKMGSYAVKDTLTIKEVTLSAAKARSTYTFLKSGGGGVPSVPPASTSTNHAPIERQLVWN